MDIRRAENLITEYIGLASRLREERLERMRQCVTTFAEAHRAASQARIPRPLPERLAAMEAAVRSYGMLSERLRTERPAEFNIISVLRREQDELSHSRLLAWIIDPRGDHDQGTLFLSEFASLIGLDATPKALRRCHGRTEVQGPEAIIDIMMWRARDFLIFIENKIWSPEGEDQVDREFRDLRNLGRALGVPCDRQFAVFLTPNGRMPISGDPSKWICISYRQLADSFCVPLSEVTDLKVGLILTDWFSIISDWG